MASRMMVSSLSCRVSPDVDQFVEPDTRHRPSTITIFRCMIALFSDVPMATELPDIQFEYFASRAFSWTPPAWLLSRVIVTSENGRGTRGGRSLSHGCPPSRHH